METFYDIGSNKTDKVYYHRYDRFYPTFLEPLRNQKFNMLEIGIDQLGSLELWKEYFPKAYIYGADIKVEYEDKRSKVFKIDQSNDHDLQFLVDNTPSCQFIIDDGSHHPYHQYLTFIKLFPNLLEEGGVYIVEDIECNYWRSNTSVYGYPIGHFNFIDWVKGKINYVNSEFAKIQNDLNISSITFAQNCIIFTKTKLEDIPIQNRQYRLSSQT